MQLYNDVSSRCSKIITERYSTSFSNSIKLLHKDIQAPIFQIYGFVRFADEIVDTFHEYNKKQLLQDFIQETHQAIDRKISLNPVLQSFQLVVNQYNIDRHLIDAFFASMESDLSKASYNVNEYNNYIYGSAEVVGLMCLHVFCGGNKEKYTALEPYAKALGAAFQKINFLRDVKADAEDLKRVYFPKVDFNNFTQEDKLSIEQDILKDFEMAYQGIKQLPLEARLGVYVAYQYYIALFDKIKKLPPSAILEARIRVSDISKAIIVFVAKLRNRLNLL